MVGILKGMPNVSVFLNDILVTRNIEQEHLETLEMILTRLGQAGIHLKHSKCAFMLTSIKYLGHHISENGLHTTKEK